MSTRRVARIMGTLMLLGGIAVLVWALVVWRWEDPFTALYTTWQQHRLEGQLNREFEEFAAKPNAPERAVLDTSKAVHTLELVAGRFRHRASVAEAIGRIVIPRLGLNMILVNGTDEGSLRRGPGRDLRSYMPGQNRLVYVAGHRTTYLA